MPRSITDGIKSAAKKAGAFRDKYVQAAKDLGSMGQTAAGVPALKEPIKGFDRAEEIQRAAKRARK